MSRVAWALALPIIPAVAALAGFLVPLKARKAAAAVGTAGSAGAAVVLFANLRLGLPELPEIEASSLDGPVLVRFGDVAVTLSAGLSQLTWWVAAIVVLVALLVQVFSVGYLLKDDERYAPYAAQISLFTAAMLLVVVSDDLILLLIGWEVMGACSYLLIGHDRRLPEAPGAAVKAFLVTRVGDVGFLLGILVLGFNAGGFRYGDIAAFMTESTATTVFTVTALLIMLGAIGKSAQFPLHTWLPDAMAGPTPISALIHAATMVAAGAYVLVRLSDLLVKGDVRIVLAVVAMISMVLSALAALASDDIKRVLAWSTVSQVAYMMAAVSVGATATAIFHLVCHGLFKALLFLGAGAVIHMAGTNSMSAMGGLRKGAPVTFWTMTIGFAALIGLPPLAGFFSKEHVLSAVYDSPDGAALFVVGLVTALLTAAYATRAWLRTFFGKTRTEGLRAHDPNPWMLWPLVVLALPTVLFGLFAGLTPLLHGDTHPTAMGLTMTAVAVGIGLSFGIWRGDKAADPARTLGPLRTVFASGFHLDAVQNTLVVRPVLVLARVARRVDLSVVDGAAEGTGRGVGGIGRLVALGHRAGMPRQVVSVLAGALVIAAAAVVMGVWG
ncbi:NADH-quinone oxidoreductase subunit L [Phytomonospora sp. NPDC050363]|uniref:NADH-quinone oxidoreductase subunit 5 family protein n=1 Tax=Phytomonospora sp. NPDC050363 TaxID=3155642 RepID=UPI0033F1F9FA